MGSISLPSQFRLNVLDFPVLIDGREIGGELLSTFASGQQYYINATKQYRKVTWKCQQDFREKIFVKKFFMSAQKQKGGDEPPLFNKRFHHLTEPASSFKGYFANSAQNTSCVRRKSFYIDKPAHCNGKNKDSCNSLLMD